MTESPPDTSPDEEPRPEEWGNVRTWVMGCTASLILGFLALLILFGLFGEKCVHGLTYIQDPGPSNPK